MLRNRTTDPIIRLMRILSLLPHAPKKLAARALFERLADEGYRVTLRTVERDLHRLRGVLPILLDNHHRPFGWSWRADAKLDFAVLTAPQPRVHSRKQLRAAE
jgi:predicted DNA-binding transcriptional regulator YafY